MVSSVATTFSPVFLASEIAQPLDPLGGFEALAGSEDELLAAEKSSTADGVAALAVPAASATSATSSKAAPTASRALVLPCERPIRECMNHTPFLD